MNDPHVVALNYSIKHGETIDYSEAEPLFRDEPEFRLKVEDKKVQFKFKKHYATEEQARESLAEYIRAWEFDATLRRGNPDSFRLRFENAEIIDRDPTPGEVRLSATFAIAATGSVTLTVGVPEYPAPPSDITLNADARTMHHRYMGYRKGREPLESMAYFCLNMLEDSELLIGQRNRRAAAEQFNIDKSVLHKIGCLSSTKGGATARKREGTDQSLTPKERQFLDAAVKAIIRRVAERQRTPDGDLPVISWSELPSLDEDS